MVRHIIMAILLHIILIMVIIFIHIGIIMHGDFIGIQDLIIEDRHYYIITIGIDILETIRSIQEVMEYRDQADPHIIMGQ